MTDLLKRLAEGDPLNADPGLTPAELTVIRQRVLAHATVAARPFWTRTLAVAAVLAAVVGLGIVAAQRVGPPRDVVASRAAPQAPERRQMQFASPSGTRVIWIFNDAFNNEVQ